MIELKNVSAGYGKHDVIASVSFTAPKSRITVILGKNGCGKTTLFRAVSGNLRYGGSIKADGLEISAISASERAKKISVMPQMLGSPDITVRELVSFGRLPYAGTTGTLSKKDRDAVFGVMEKTGISALAESRLDRISGGERQKAYFAMLLAQNTGVMLLDEPASHLDAPYTVALLDFLKSEKERGKTILAVFHDINRAVEIADRIVVLDEGAAVFEGSPADFCESGLAETVFGLRKYVCSAPDGSPAVLYR